MKRVAAVALVFLSAVPSAHARFSPETYQRFSREKKIEASFPSFAAVPFSVFTEKPLDAPSQRAIQRIVQDTLRAAGSDLGYTPSEPMDLVLLEGNSYDSIDDPEIASGGFYRAKKIRIRFDFSGDRAAVLEMFAAVFRHEYTHLAVAALDAGKSPRWLHEGLAVYVEKGRAGRRRGEGREFYQKLQRDGKAPPLRDLMAGDLRKLYGLQGEGFYEHSYVLAKYLADQHGFAKLREFFRAMKTGQSFTGALQGIYGLDMDTLARRAYEN